MDEPFGALDAITKASLQDVLLRVQQETGATVVFITHDLDEAIYLSDRVLVISGNPGTITVAVDTELPRPRDQLATRELPRYLQVRHLLGQALRDADG
jgi:NitT/TauT family transport system ATP-binding protein